MNNIDKIKLQIIKIVDLYIAGVSAPQPATDNPATLQTMLKVDFAGDDLPVADATLRALAELICEAWAMRQEVRA